MQEMRRRTWDEKHWTWGGGEGGREKGGQWLKVTKSALNKVGEYVHTCSALAHRVIVAKIDCLET